MITKEINTDGKKRVIACDGNCKKAFGKSGRPFIKLNEDFDGIKWYSDNELANAPVSGDTFIVSKDGDFKPNPIFSETLLNKWCFKECERCVSVNLNEPIHLPDFNKRQPYKPYSVLK